MRTSDGRSMWSSSSSTGRARDDGGDRGDQVGAGAAALVHPGLDVRAGRSVSAGALALPPLERAPARQEDHRGQGSDAADVSTRSMVNAGVIYSPAPCASITSWSASLA